jgi:glycosyltransferase involved in cell wall biosynthesis
VYDDCSTDNTADVAKKLGAKVLRGEKNVGCSAGKQALAKRVQTDWVHFHDADDELLPNFVTLARRWIDRGDSDVVLFAYEYRDDATGALLALSTFDNSALNEDPKRYTILRQINPFCGLYRREVMLAAGGYDLDPRTLYNEDVAFHIRLAFAGLTFAAESEVSIINWRIAGSMSASNPQRCALSHLYVMLSTLARSDAAPYRSEISYDLWRTAGILASFSDWKNARLAVVTAASIAPVPKSEAKVWFRFLAAASPYAAIRTREATIRLFKPHLRRHLI